MQLLLILYLLWICNITLQYSISLSSPTQVTVAVIDLEPVFSYVSVPRLSPHSFLQATVKNTSHYAILAGPANVFLDNNFLTKVTNSPGLYRYKVFGVVCIVICNLNCKFDADFGLSMEFSIEFTVVFYHQAAK